MPHSAHRLDPNDPEFRIKIRKRINNLSRKNAQERDPKIEERIVLLRQKLAADYSAPFPKQTPAMRFKKNPFSNVKGLPEISYRDLSTGKLAAGILNHGAIIVRGLYDQPMIKYLLERAAFNERLNDELGTHRQRQNPFAAFTLREIQREIGLYNFVRQYLGDEAVIMYERNVLRTHKKRAVLNWHQDFNFFGGRCFALNCWAAVTPCGGKRQGLSFIPKRNEDGIGWDLSKGSAPFNYGKGLKHTVIAEMAKDHPIVTPEFAPGDAVFFDEMTMHATAVGQEKDMHQVVTVTWFAHHSKVPDHIQSLAF